MCLSSSCSQVPAQDVYLFGSTAGEAYDCTASMQVCTPWHWELVTPERTVDSVRCSTLLACVMLCRLGCCHLLGMRNACIHHCIAFLGCSHCILALSASRRLLTRTNVGKESYQAVPAAASAHGQLRTHPPVEVLLSSLWALYTITAAADVPALQRSVVCMVSFKSMVIRTTLLLSACDTCLAGLL